MSGTVQNNDERRDLMKMIKYTILDLEPNSMNESLNHITQNEEVEEEQPEPKSELASEPQKIYMAKLNIPFTESTTKIEAIDLINQYKLEHNIPIRHK